MLGRLATTPFISCGRRRQIVMGFWSGYWASLKPLEVEEPIDVYVHRPLAYVVARLSFPLPISPNAITFSSILAGLGSAAALLAAFPHHLQVGGGLLFASAILDCADGQLARMRRTSSAFGRMLDGSADFFTVGSVAPVTVWLIWCSVATSLWEKLVVLALSVLTIVTSSFHTTMYDHYKNVFLRLTGPYEEGEDYEAAVARKNAEDPATRSWVSRICYPIYLFYLKSQRDYVLKFDPYTSAPPQRVSSVRRRARRHLPVDGWAGDEDLALVLRLRLDGLRVGAFQRARAPRILLGATARDLERRVFPSLAILSASRVARSLPQNEPDSARSRPIGGRMKDPPSCSAPAAARAFAR